MDTEPDNARTSGAARLARHLTDRLLPFNTRPFRVVVSTVMILLLGAVLVLGWLSSRKVREVVTSDFNQQQLVLAQHAARQIENDLDALKKELLLLSLSPSVQYFEKVSLGNRMGITYSSIRERAALEIRYIDDLSRRVYTISDRGYSVETMRPGNVRHLAWARNPHVRGTALISDVSVAHGARGPVLLMNVVAPVWQVSVDEAHPVASGNFSGVLIADIDATLLAEQSTRDIRSGKTGYAWVIDHHGTFLYHPEGGFVGRNAFEVRTAKQPAISYTRINEIQKDLMLAGKEGASWYISGWHRGVEAEMKKLIAYTPIRLDARDEGRIWSVAVVAPVSEVEGTVHGIQVRQFLLEGVVVFVILGGGGMILGILLRWSRVLQDEVRAKTSELRKSEDQYRSLIEHANDIIFIVDPAGVFTAVNEAGLTFFRKKREEITGRNLGEICLNEDSAAAQFRAIDEVFRTQASKQITYPVTIEGNTLWVSTNFSALRDERGEVYAVLGIARDITRRKKMEEQMYHTEKLASMGTLAAGVAHEINNPLAIILGFTDLLRDKATDPEVRDVLQTIERHGTNAKRVVENLLSFARYTEYKVEDVDVNACLDAVLAVARNSLALSKIEVVKRHGAGLPFVKANAGELQQVFFNIVTNAIWAMKGGGRLTVETEPAGEGSAVTARISDTGCGIKKEHRMKIFDPLFTTKGVGEGTGLGLSVSYGIITKYGGSITFETRTAEESDAPGTTFIVTLPASAPA